MPFEHILLKLYFKQECMRTRRSFQKDCTSQGAGVLGKIKSLAVLAWPELTEKSLRFYYCDDENDDCVLLPETWDDAVLTAAAVGDNKGEDSEHPVVIRVTVVVEDDIVVADGYGQVAAKTDTARKSTTEENEVQMEIDKTVEDKV
ncbi:hypothetical protein FOL47_009453 [Perkinsus chesapeaki]|uniref:Uncharacterized protein n=1 Tax=Perkinsus chesapeaki TaxID=330153 RepID=A0A7J6MTS3_PERCH|nr:hypothetical protein FOL47_009453 [Perkinsus chesapeaki]